MAAGRLGWDVEGPLSGFASTAVSWGTLQDPLPPHPTRASVSLPESGGSNVRIERVVRYFDNTASRAGLEEAANE